MTTLVSLEVTRRQKEKEELKQKQKYEMGLNQVNHSKSLSENSSSAFNDKHIFTAMREVNKSDETIDESLTRINGTFFWNRGKTKQLIQELTDKQDLDDENDYENTLDAEKLITKYGSPRDLKVMMNIKNKHDEVGQLGIRDKKIRDGLHQKYLQKIKDGTAFNNDKFTPIKESGSWNKICEQLEKPRLNLNSRSFFGQLRESLQTKNKRRLLTMKRVNQYE